jgi:hypothetical protein
MNFSVTKNGKPLNSKLYSWDPKTNTFSSNENGLVLDFYNIDGVSFKTGSYCTFKTGFSCTFDTGSHCTFDTGSYCTFKTGSNCTFKTDSHCTFDTDCNCTFDTGSHCTFDTDCNCTFKTGSQCTFKTCSNCVCIRRDIFEIIEIPKEKTIKLNSFEIKGYTFLNETKTITIDGKEIEISNESFENLKKQLCE